MDTAAQDDRSLVEAVRRGNPAGLEGVYRRYADRLRPWLYAIVRNECLRHLREGACSRPLGETDDPVADLPDPGAGVNADQVRALVHAAAASLRDRRVTGSGRCVTARHVDAGRSTNRSSPP
ncbi:RNA polymerase sigma factor [Micromonospora craniellae]|nr:hypothetical protein [Micromonospora craniellae]QOC91362.1 hypothetical protein ID554_25805 [Micromonospora craniellae]